MKKYTFFLVVDLHITGTHNDNIDFTIKNSSHRYHSVFISHALPSFLANVTPFEAAEYVLPLLPSLAMDEGTPIPDFLLRV